VAPQAVIFDFDGTLVDTMDGFADIAAGVIHRRFGLPPDRARAEYLATSGLPFRQQLDLIVPGRPGLDEAAAEFEAAKLDGFFAERFSDDVRAAVAGLQARGILAIVSSNNFQHLIDAFVARDPAVRFDLVLGARENFFKGADHFAHIERTFAIPRDRMLFVGDSLKDGERARDCNVPFVARLGTFTRQDFERRFPGVRAVETLSQLLEIL
jgi:phosphoglycolate phosphatase